MHQFATSYGVLANAELQTIVYVHHLLYQQP